MQRLTTALSQVSENSEVVERYLATPGPGTSTARSVLSETYLRRLSKLPLDDVEDKDFNTTSV